MVHNWASLGDMRCFENLLNHCAETHLRLQWLRMSCELCYTWLSHPMHLVTRHLPHHFYYQPHGFKCHHSRRHCIPNWRADQASQLLQQRSLHRQTSSVDIDSSGLYLSMDTNLFRSCPTQSDFSRLVWVNSSSLHTKLLQASIHLPARSQARPTM